tara:strand:- start:22991 stop:23644 length:654 start_codon:yes stop_codon:yes gene_type:complete
MFSKKEEFLRNKDKKLKKIIDMNGHIKFKPRKENQFDTLVEIVISQFISTSAANSIFLRIKKNFNTVYLKETHFQKLTINEVKNLGLSTNKARTIKELSELYLDKTFVELSSLNNDEMSRKLLSIFGIGPWSINMFEIFCLGKQNVFSSKDAGLRLAMNNFGFVKPESRWTEYDKYAEKWKPFKTTACIHLWKTVDLKIIQISYNLSMFVITYIFIY